MAHNYQKELIKNIKKWGSYVMATNIIVTGCWFYIIGLLHNTLAKSANWHMGFPPTLTINISMTTWSPQAGHSAKSIYTFHRKELHQLTLLE